VNFIEFLPSFFTVFVFLELSPHVKRQLRKNIALPNINTEKEAQIKANVDRVTNFFSVRTYFSTKLSNSK
jgi:hypothetical protein